MTKENEKRENEEKRGNIRYVDSYKSSCTVDNVEDQNPCRVWRCVWDLYINVEVH